MASLDLPLELQPKQSLLLELCENSKATTIGYGGSRGGGKSGAARRIMLIRRLNNPGTTGIIFRRVWDDLKKNHVDPFFSEFPKLFDFYRSSDHEVILPAVANKPPSRIIFSYAETEAEVKRKFHGPEFMDMFLDQAEQLSEPELKYMKMCNRWPRTKTSACKFVLFFNPGGKSMNYFKRVFKDMRYEEKERSEDFAFIQAYGWDNVEWVTGALIDDGYTKDQFYQWSDQERFTYFVTRSQYGRELDGLPPAMRIGHLLGSLDAFSGQFFDIWSPAEQTRRAENMSIEPWHPKWISIDWGFAHNSAVHWHSQDGSITKTYREVVKNHLSPRELAWQIIQKCNLFEGKEKDQIDAVYLSPDAFAKRSTEQPFSKQIGDVLRSHGLPFPRPADNDRKSGWMLMYEKLKAHEWIISQDCKELIKVIPMMSRDEDDDIEDCIKFDGDDAADCARYGLKTRFRNRKPPREVQLSRHIEQVVEECGLTPSQLSELNTLKHLAHLRFDQNWNRTHAAVRKTRNWRPNTF